MYLRITSAAIGVFLIGYLLQLPTPLRLNPDAVVYVSLGASLADGQGLQFYHTPSHFPPGLPLLYAGLSRAGWLCSTSIVAINIFFLLLGCACAIHLLKNGLKLGTSTSLWIVLLTLASHIFIKHVTLPISDIAYFGLSLAALALILSATQAQSRMRAHQLLLAALPITAAAISVRYIGVALLPAIAWALILIHRQSIRHIKPSTWTLIILGLLTGMIAVAALAIRSLYVHEMLDTYSGNGGPLGTIRLICQYRARELGELFINIPGNHLPHRLNVFVPALGVMLAIAVAWAMIKRCRQWGPTEIYLLAFAAIMATWPYSDIRFHAPILPVLFGLIAATFSPVPQWRRIAVVIYTVMFCAFGWLALGYSTSLTYSGKRFADRYGDKPDLRAAYHLAFYGTAAPNGVQPDIHMLDMLRRYEKLSIPAD